MSASPARQIVDNRWQPADGRRLIVCVLYVGCFVRGISLSHGESALFEMLFTAFFASGTTFWAVLDARVHGRPMTYSMQFLCCIFWFMALPIYLMRTRGWVGVGWAFATFGGGFALLMFSLIATMILQQISRM